MFRSNIDKFSNELPISVILTVEYDRTMRINGTPSSQISELVLHLIEQCGKDIISMNGRHSAKQTEAYETYINRIKACIESSRK